MMECRRISTFSRSASLLCLALGTNVEADDDGVRGGGEEDVGLGDGADAGVEDADANLLGGHALEGVGEDFDGALHVALEDEVEVLHAGLLDLLGEAFERDAGALGELGFALLHLAVLGDALGLVAVGHDEEGVACVGHAFEAEDFDRGGGAGFGDGAAAVVEHGADLAEGVADDVAVAGAEGSVLDEDAGDGAAAAIELGFDDGADGGTVGLGLLFVDVGDEADHLFELVEVDVLLRGDFDELGVATHGWRAAGRGWRAAG